MNILITGIHGFIGNNLVTSLHKNHSIYGLDIIAPIKKGIIKTFYWNELEHIPSIDLIIHLAGKAHDTKNQANAQTYFDVNTGLTKKIYDWYLLSNAKKFIFFSSVKAAADHVEVEPLTEEVVTHPKGPYGESKILAEQYILSQPLNENKRIYILRPCMIHGPGNKGNLNLLYKVVQKGIPWPLGAYENRRSFASIDNLTYIINQLIEKEIESGIYQIADDEALSTNELISLIASSLNEKAKILNLPKTLIYYIAKTGNYLHMPLNTERLKKLTESYVVSNQKIKKALNINSMPVRAIDGLKKTFESFQK